MIFTDEDLKSIEKAEGPAMTSDITISSNEYGWYIYSPRKGYIWPDWLWHDYCSNGKMPNGYYSSKEIAESVLEKAEPTLFQVYVWKRKALMAREVQERIFRALHPPKEKTGFLQQWEERLARFDQLTFIKKVQTVCTFAWTFPTFEILIVLFFVLLGYACRRM